MGCNQSTAVPSVNESFDSLSNKTSVEVGNTSGETLQNSDNDTRNQIKSGHPGEGIDLKVQDSGDVGENRGAVTNKFNEQLWNAFGDGSVSALKTAHEARYKDVSPIASFPAILYF